METTASFPPRPDFLISLKKIPAAPPPQTRQGSAQHWREKPCGNFFFAKTRFIGGTSFGGMGFVFFAVFCFASLFSSRSVCWTPCVLGGGVDTTCLPPPAPAMEGFKRGCERGETSRRDGFRIDVHSSPLLSTLSPPGPSCFNMLTTRPHNRRRRRHRPRHPPAATRCAAPPSHQPP